MINSKQTKYSNRQIIICCCPTNYKILKNSAKMLSGMQVDDNEMNEIIDQFLRKTNFKDSFRSAVADKSRFNVKLDEVREFSPKLSQFLLKNPIKAINLFEIRVNKLIDDLNNSIASEKVKMINPSSFPVKHNTLKLNFDGNYGKNFVTPRGLKSSMINTLVKVQGIVTRMSIVKPKLAKSYHYIPATKQGYVQEYKDQYSVEGQGNFTSKLFPTKDAAGNLMTAEYGYWNYSNVQKLIIQEMPERTPTGQIPRSVIVFLQDDLVDKVKPGDRVELSGIFKWIPTSSSSTSGVFKTVIVCTGVTTISDKSDKIKITPEDVMNIKKVAERKDMFGVLASSIAPTVQGHINIK